MTLNSFLIIVTKVKQGFSLSSFPGNNFFCLSVIAPCVNFLDTSKLLVNNGKLSLLNLNHHHLALLAPCSPHSDSTTHATATILFAMASRPSLLHFYALCVLFQHLEDAQIWKYLC